MKHTNPEKTLIASLKETASKRGPQLQIPVCTPPEAFLRPVSCRTSEQRKDDIRVLTDWRNRHANAFLTEFYATERRTSAWLNNTVLPDDGRILFMLDNPAGLTFGYMGLAFINWETLYAEADAIVKGIETRKGMMTDSLKALISWAQSQLGLKKISVRVRSDNPAVNFYRKFGFSEEKQVPLQSSMENGEKIWRESHGEPTTGVSLVYMTLNSEAI